MKITVKPKVVTGIAGINMSVPILPPSLPVKPRVNTISGGGKSEETKVIVNVGGGVQQDKTTYIGNAVVPATQMTANQTRTDIQRRAIEQGIVRKEDINKTYLTETYSNKKETTNPSQRVNTISDKSYNLPNLKPNLTMLGSDINFINYKREGTIYPKGTIYSVPSGVAGRTKQGKEVPLFKSYVVQEVGASKEATKEETSLLKGGLISVESTKTRGKIQTIKGETLGKIQELSAKDIISNDKYKQIEKSVIIGTDVLIGGTALGKSFPSQRKELSGFIGSAGTSFILPQTKGDIISTGLGFGVGSVVGGGTKVGGRVLKYIGGKVGGLIKKEGVYTGESIALKIGKVGIIGAGVYGAGTIVGSNLVGLKGKSSVEAGRSVGKQTRELVAFGYGTKAGSRLYDISSDYFRTAKLKEIPAKSVIAPEFYQGQKYPAVKRGQTAKQLKKEFYEPISILKEEPNIPRGFTASPSSFNANTKIGKGTSEVPGLFSAPKISPTFFKVSNEKPKLIGFGDILISEPTALRVEFNNLRYAKGVRASSKVGSVGGYQKSFFEKIKGTGSTYIPAVKTEKESITAYDSLIKETSSKNFIEFEGRKIPIKNVKVLSNEEINNLPNLPKKELKKITTLGKINEQISYSSSSKSKITPLNFLYSSSKRGGRYSSTKSIISSPSASNTRYSSSLSKISSSVSKNSRRSYISSLSSLGSSRSRSSSISSLVSGRGGSSYNYPKPQKKPVVLVNLLRSQSSRKIGKPFKEQRRELVYAPDLTSATLGLTKRVSKSQLKKLALNPSPLGLRRIPIIR